MSDSESNDNTKSANTGGEEDPKIGVYICHCGHNIAGTVDVEKVINEVKDLPNVEEAEINKSLCRRVGISLVLLLDPLPYYIPDRYIDLFLLSEP